MSPRPDVSAQRMPQILGAAAAVFGRLGLGAATVADIAEAAGLSKALVFKYFRSKDELVLALLRSMFEELPLPVRGKDQGVEACLLAWAENAAQAVMASPAFAAVGTELLALASRDPAMRAMVGLAYGRLHAALAAIVAEGVAEGVFETTDTDTDAAAAALIAQTEGANLLFLVGLSGFSLPKSYRDGVALILAGLQAPGGTR